MKCLNEGYIQAYIDRELDKNEIREVEAHLFDCEKCKALYREMNSANNLVRDSLMAYKKDLIYEKLENSLNNKKGVFDNMKRYKSVIVAAGLVLVITTCIAVKPIRAAISDMVSIFRIQELKSVNISLNDINKLKEAIKNQESNIDIDKIGKVNYQGGEKESVTIEGAKNSLSFAVLTPRDIALTSINDATISKPSQVDFTLDVDNVNQILKSLGENNIFPKELDGKTFTLKMGGVLEFSYNDKNNKYINITESKVPEIFAPSGINIDELFNALSGLSILPPAMQSQLKTMKDWKSALYIPNVDNRLEELNINGTKAVYSMDKEYSSILVLKDGVLIGIRGNVSKSEIIDIVKSLR